MTNVSLVCPVIILFPNHFYKKIQCRKKGDGSKAPFSYYPCHYIIPSTPLVWSSQDDQETCPQIKGEFRSFPHLILTVLGVSLLIHEPLKFRRVLQLEPTNPTLTQRIPVNLTRLFTQGLIDFDDFPS